MDYTINPQARRLPWEMVFTVGIRCSSHEIFLGR